MKCKMRFFHMLFMAAAMVLILMGSKVQAEASECKSVDVWNKDAQNYTKWSSTIESYLTYDGANKIMRVQASQDSESDVWVLAEYYDKSYKRLSQKVIPKELPIFGGFYESDDHYYIVSGQANPYESNSIEVIRITQYDKNWNRMKSVGLYGANTTDPFAYGSLRMADDGEYLLIRTCHEMYKTSDGVNHQANVTIQVKMDSMQITDYQTGISNIQGGYVSHSFNQFVGIDNGKMVAVDHGDAYPRGIPVIKYNRDVSSGTFNNYSCAYENLITFSGEIGDNATGASIGAFEINENGYLVAGNYVGDNQSFSGTRNIFVAYSSKDLSTPEIKWITSYKQGEESPSTPHMVSIGNNQYMLLWSRGGNVFYTKLDQYGSKVGKIYEMEADLSDCKPILVNGTLVWYVDAGNEITFYQIDCANLSSTSSNTQHTGHSYSKKGTGNGYITIFCSKCGKTATLKTPNYQRLYWGDTIYGLSTTFNERLKLDEERYLLYAAFDENSNSMEDIEEKVTISDESIVKLEKVDAGLYRLIPQKDGIVQITVEPRFFLELKETLTFYVGNAVKEGLILEDGLWFYYQQNAWAKSHTGLVKNGSEWWYVRNGLWSTYTGLCQYNGSWYYVKKGVLDWSYTGLCQYNGSWFYVKKGMLDWNYTGLCQYNGSWYYVKKGKLDWNYTGLTQYYGTWYYVNKGILDWKYTGLSQYNGTWYYVKKGVLDWSYTGLCQYGSSWYYVKKGVLDWNYTGLCQYYGTWYYMKKGVLDWNYTGLTQYYGTWYYVKKGVLDWNYTGLCQYNRTWYYVKKGVLDWNYTGLCQYNRTWYYVNKGILDWNYTGKVLYDGRWYQVVKGVLR